ncbi:MAG: AI-2E family transporter [Clostridium sp.]
MKINWNSKYNTISVYAFLVTSAIIAFYLSLSKIDTFMGGITRIIGILQPFIIGFSIAYLLNFVLEFYEKKVFETKAVKKLKLKSKRGLGLLFTYATMFLVFGLFIRFVLPQLVDSIVGLTNDIPKYINDVTKFIDETMRELNIGEENYQLVIQYVDQFINYVIGIVTGMIPVLGGLVATIAASVWNIILGLIISVYILIDKEKFIGLGRKITLALLSETKAKRVLEITHRSNYTFGRFLSGKILDSTIIGILTFVILTVVNMPYTLLISVIIGVTNIIPFFGPFIGAVPALIIVVFVSPSQALWLAIIILVIQQIDGNIIGPKILGDSIGISAFWILFSILVAGKLLGFVGMIIGVPLFAVVYSIIKELVEARLKEKGLKPETKEYM